MIRISMAEFNKITKAKAKKKLEEQIANGINPTTIFCEGCGEECNKTGFNQKYCPACSVVKARARQSKWQREKGKKLTKEESKEKSSRQHSAFIERGLAISDSCRMGSDWNESPPMSVSWERRLAVPFSYAFSKNHYAAFARDGHVFLRKESKALREHLTFQVRQSVSDAPVVTNKLWIAMLVQKPDHRGDAVNVFDLACDAIKVGVGIDDRWFCIRKLDWQVVKTNPQIFIRLSQEENWNGQVCSYCGRILPMYQFQSNKSNKSGYCRGCTECVSSRKRS